MTRLWLIRHGEPAEEARNRCYGALDIGLSEQGRMQMTAVAEYLRTEPIAAIYASPRLRALESARIIATVNPNAIDIVRDLREIDFGDFEGLTYEEIAARYPDLYRKWMETPTEVRFPNGETFADMRSRVLTAFGAIRLKQNGQTAMIVSHGGVNRILLAQALHIPNHRLFSLAQDYAAMNLVSFTDGSSLVHSVNHRAAGPCWQQTGGEGNIGIGRCDVAVPGK